MFNNLILDSDAFTDMPAEAQLLYIRLNMVADDDGIVGNPRRVMRSYGFSDDSMKILISKKFVLLRNYGESYVCLIKHWKMHNSIKKDRYKPSTYHDLLRDVYYDENKAYSLNPGDGHYPVLSSVSTLETNWSQDVSADGAVLDPQNRLDKDRLGKVSVDKDSEDNNSSFLEEKQEKEEKPEWYWRAKDSLERLGYWRNDHAE